MTYRMTAYKSSVLEPLFGYCRYDVRDVIYYQQPGPRRMSKRARLQAEIDAEGPLVGHAAYERREASRARLAPMVKGQRADVLPFARTGRVR